MFHTILDPAVPDFDISTFLGSTEPVEERPSGSVIFSQGDTGSCLYVIRSGEVSIRVDNKILTRLGPGKLFGEMSLIDRSPRSASAIAETDVGLIAIDEKRFVFLVQHHPFFPLEIMRIIAERLRSTNRLL